MRHEIGIEDSFVDIQESTKEGDIHASEHWL